jgi:hypothetical protein
MLAREPTRIFRVCRLSEKEKRRCPLRDPRSHRQAGSVAPSRCRSAPSNYWADRRMTLPRTWRLGPGRHNSCSEIPRCKWPRHLQAVDSSGRPGRANRRWQPRRRRRSTPARRHRSHARKGQARVSPTQSRGRKVGAARSAMSVARRFLLGKGQRVALNLSRSTASFPHRAIRFANSLEALARAS